VSLSLSLCVCVCERERERGDYGARSLLKERIRNAGNRTRQSLKIHRVSASPRRNQLVPASWGKSAAEGRSRIEVLGCIMQSPSSYRSHRRRRRRRILIGVSRGLRGGRDQEQSRRCFRSAIELSASWPVSAGP
jgi:hypothetical protein